MALPGVSVPVLPRRPGGVNRYARAGGSVEDDERPTNAGAAASF